MVSTRTLTCILFGSLALGLVAKGCSGPDKASTNINGLIERVYNPETRKETYKIVGDLAIATSAVTGGGLLGRYFTRP